MQLIKNNIVITLLFFFLIFSIFIKNKSINQTALVICFYFSFRWITNYRKCTISFIECKIRGVKKNNGFLFNINDPIIDINKTDYRFLFYILILIIICCNIDNLNNNLDFLLPK